VVAHEMYHFLGHTEEHSAAGIAKSKYSAADLVSDQLDFDAAALNHLRKNPLEPAPVDVSGDSAGTRNEPFLQ
jgi:hypothetical protein